MTRYLIIRLSALGDVAMVCAAIREAALLHPENRYTLLSRPRMKEMLCVMPDNVTFHPYGEPIVWADYDRVIDLHRVWRSLGISLAARCHGKSVRSLCKPRLGRWTICHGLRKTPLRPMLQRYRALLGLPEQPALLPPPFPVSQKQGVGVAPFAAHQGKVYPLDRMEDVVRRLSEHGEQVKLFGFGLSEAAILQAWADKYPGVESLCGKHTMGEELQIMAGLRTIITMDSGNMHLASLVGTRVVSIWGATSPALGFLGAGQVQNDCVSRCDLPCRPCSAYGKTPCHMGDYRCLHIAPEEVVRIVMK